jgi:hypothetical protein
MKKKLTTTTDNLIEIAGKKNFNTCADLVLEIE